MINYKKGKEKTIKETAELTELLDELRKTKCSKKQVYGIGCWLKKMFMHLINKTTDYLFPSV